MKTNKIYVGNTIDVLKTLPEKSINCCVTSPPYWGLRDYGTEHKIWGGSESCKHDFHITAKTGNFKFRPGHNSTVGNHTKKDIWKEGSGESTFCSKCGAWKGEFGLEPTPDLFIDHMVEIFRDVKRVLKDDGTLWLNLGDSYSRVGGAQVEQTIRGDKNKINAIKGGDFISCSRNPLYLSA